MKTTTTIRQRLPWIVSLLMAAGVFAYWTLVNPQLLYYRETMQLFLCDSHYFLQRLAVPGGLAQYLGELVTACFLLPALGAAIHAFVFLASWQLSERLLGGHCRYLLTLVVPLALVYVSMQPALPMTLTVALLLTMGTMALMPRQPRWGIGATLAVIPIGYWLVGPVIMLMALYPLRFLRMPAMRRWAVGGAAGVLLLGAVSIVGSSRLVAYPLRQLAMGIDYHWTSEMMGTNEEMTYDMLSRKQDWEAIAHRYMQHPTDSPVIRAVAQYAFFRMGMVSEQDLQKGIAPSFGSQSSLPAMLMTSEIYLQIGLVNMSQRNAFEAMEGIPNCNKSGRVLHRLVETNLITGQYDVALKYISILERTPFYRAWARRMRQLAEHPQRIGEHTFYDTLQKAYRATNDSFF